MNHILKLQEQNKDLKGRLRDIEDALSQFNTFLHSEKFRGIEGGEEKDWIRTADVILRLQEIKQLTYY